MDAAQTPACTLKLFGPPTLAAPGPTFTRTRRFQLLAYLAISARAVDRDRLAFLFWPDLGNEQARRNLRKMLYDVRSAPWLAACPLHSDSLSISWPVATDLQQFQAALQARRWALAVALAQPPLAEGLEGANPEFDAWLLRERAHLRGQWRHALLQALGEDTAGQEPLRDAAGQALLDDALDEDLACARVRWLLRHRGAPAARRAYDDWARSLGQALALAPTLSWAQLQDGANSQDLGARPALPRTTAPVPQLASFVGRQRELAEIKRHLVEGRRRLVTVLGPPGVGKTRLVRQFAERWLADADVAFVALEGLDAHLGPPGAAGGDASLALVAAIGQALGLGHHDGADAAATLMDALRRAEPLLVLDNFEHRLGDLPLLQRLLAETRVALLVTSRSRLGLSGETVLQLDGLSLDAQGGDEALQLLVERAGLPAPLAPPLLQAARRLCSLAGGQPLAIELAARQCRHLALHEVARRLEAGMDALTASAADLPPRQRSLSAAFQGSWRLLAPPLQQALARLSVLGGDFSSSMAAVVVGAPPGAVEGTLADLVDASLLRLDPATGRHAWHPFAREMAAAQLAAGAPESALAARRALCLHVVQTLQRLGLVEVHPDPAAMAWVARELPHVMAAWRLAVTEPLHVAWEPLAEALAMHFEVHARYREGAALLALARPDAAPARVAARVAVLRARLQHWLQSDEARATALAARAVFIEHEDLPGRVACGRLLGVIAWRQGDAAQALAEFTAALALAHDAGLEGQRAILLDGLGLAQAHLGRNDEAMSCFRQALLLNQRLGNPYQLVQNLVNLSLGQRHSAPHDALPLARRALQVAQEIGYAHYLPHCLGTLARAHLAHQEHEDALAHARQAADMARGSGDAYIESWTLQSCAAALLALGHHGPARADLRRGLEVAWDTQDTPLVLRHLLLAGRLAQAVGEAHWARHLLAVVAGHASLPHWLLGELALVRKALVEGPDTAAPPDAAAAADALPGLVQAALGWLLPVTGPVHRQDP